MTASMTPAYFQSLVVHLLQQAAHPHVVSVRTYAEAGVIGPGWGRYGIEIVDRAGQVTLLGIVRGSSTHVGAVALDGLPAEYTPDP